MLCLNGIRDDIRQRSIIADTAGQQKGNLILNALIHNTGIQYFLIDGILDAAQAANAVDGTQVMLVSFFAGTAVFHGNAQAGAIKGFLYIVSGERITGEQQIHIAFPNQLAEVISASGMHDSGAGDYQNFTISLSCPPHFRGYFSDGYPFGFFAGDRAVHEGESGNLRCTSLCGQNPCTSISNHHEFSLFDIRHRQAVGRLSVRTDDDAAIHFL